MKNIRRLLHSSIIKVLVGGFLLVIVPVVTLCLIYSFSSMNMLRDEFDVSYANNTKLISEQFSDKLRDLEMTAVPRLVDEELILSEQVPDLWDFNIYKNELVLDFASRFISANVSVILPTQKRVISTKYGIEFFDKYASLSNLGQLSAYLPTWAVRGSLRNPNENCLSVIIGYTRPEQSRPLISIEISESEIIGQLKSLFSNNDKVLSSFLIDINGEVMKLDENGILDDTILNTIMKQSRENADSEPFTYKDNNGLHRIVFSKLENYQCLIGIIYDEKAIIEPVTKMIPYLVLIIAFAVIVVISYIMVSYKKIYAPANILIDAMKCVANGELQTHTHIKDNSEFGMMSTQFNSMVDQLDRSLKEKYLAQSNLNKAQLKFLKSQIKPHFLYNCLFSLYNMIKSDDLDNAANMAIYLGRFYQMSSHFDDRDTTVIQEIENIKLYLNIHQLRSPEKFEYTCIIDPKLETMAIPVLSLQTIVENAVSHAFEMNDWKNIVEIKVIYNGENIELSVTDNGIGLSEEQQKELLKQTDTLDISEEMHGNKNVFMRFKLMYGASVQESISSQLGSGTTFTISIPSANIKLESKGDLDV